MAVKMANKFLERVAVAREFKISRVNMRRTPGMPRERNHFPEIKENAR